jgi:hypothetical protein
MKAPSTRSDLSFLRKEEKRLKLRHFDFVPFVQYIRLLVEESGRVERGLGRRFSILFYRRLLGPQYAITEQLFLV